MLGPQASRRHADARRLSVSVHATTEMVEITETDRPQHGIEVEWWELEALIADLQAMRLVGLGTGQLEPDTRE